MPVRSATVFGRQEMTFCLYLLMMYNTIYDDKTLRLEAKLATGMVQKVHIQFGADTERLKSALQMLTTLHNQCHPLPNDLRDLRLYIPTHQSADSTTEIRSHSPQQDV
eukprot:scaffold5143_cov131-Skeletonema_menzelii.AAC.4